MQFKRRRRPRVRYYIEELIVSFMMLGMFFNIYFYYWVQKTNRTAIKPLGPLYVDAHMVMHNHITVPELILMAQQPHRYQLSEDVRKNS